MDIKMLRRGFKAVCKATDNRFQNYQIRVHRSLSWLERALELDQESQPDGRLLYAWIAFSSLCGRWDLEAGYPVRDKECREAFLEMLMGIDRAGMLGEKIVALESDILWLLENKFLDPRFWKDPDKPGNVRAKYHLALRLYHDKNWGGIMQHTLDRIAVSARANRPRGCNSGQQPEPREPESLPQNSGGPVACDPTTGDRAPGRRRLAAAVLSSDSRIVRSEPECLSERRRCELTVNVEPCSASQ